MSQTQSQPLSSTDVLLRKRELSQLGGGLERQTKQREGGRGTARDRIFALLDPGSFEELDDLVTHRCQDFGMSEQKVLGDSVVTGVGKIHGRNVCVYSQDFTVSGGSLSSAHAAKICKVMDLALKLGCPMIGINDSGGARIQEGVESLGGYADIFFRNTRASGVIPQISLIMGPCAGGAVYSPAITDFVFMVDQSSFMFVTGPDVIKTVTHEEVSKEALGGAEAHATKSGVAHKVFENEAQAIQGVRDLIQFLPDNHMDGCYEIGAVGGDSGGESARGDLQELIPENPNKPYDMAEVIRYLSDDQKFFEIHENHARNILTGFIRMGGMSVGVVANQPNHLAGCLDIHASLKGARFVRFCDAFRIPILSLVDVPGFLPGVAQEHNGIIRHGAKLLYAYAEATVPRITLITRKAYGGAYVVMSCKQLGSDFNFALPQSEIAVMGAEGAIQILYRKELQVAQEKGKLDEKRAEILQYYRSTIANPYKAAERGDLDKVLLPAEVRSTLIRSLKLLKNKKVSAPKRRHGNIPL